jgi:protein-L-isoaspartate(D-aspartate) O-methyltransferase
MATLSACARGRHETTPLASPNSTGQPSGTAAIGPAQTDRQHPAFHERDDERQELARILAEEGIKDPAVLRALRMVPRHAFVTSQLQASAYSDQPLPIVGGQTISQPYVVAFMTEAARPTAGSVCLEIGTGSGYQAAILAEFCKRTYSIEYLPEVARFGEKHLRELGYGPERVLLRVGDGYGGWPDAAPFDVILVTAAPERVPAPLLEQLAVGGRLVIPVGASDGVQQLERWTRRRPGQDAAAFRIETLLPVRFVPFAGERAKARTD